jgi:hypothetical protein
MNKKELQEKVVQITGSNVRHVKENKKLVQQIAILTADNNDLTGKDLAHLEHGLKMGLHLADQPFIPEYMGFEETTDDSSGRTTRIYSRDGFCLSKTRQDLSDDNPHNNMRWLVMDTTKVIDAEDKYPTSTVFFDSMYHAIIILNGLGMNLPMQTDSVGDIATTLEELVEEKSPVPFETVGPGNLHKKSAPPVFSSDNPTLVGIKYAEASWGWGNYTEGKWFIGLTQDHEIASDFEWYYEDIPDGAKEFMEKNSEVDDEHQPDPTEAVMENYAQLELEDEANKRGFGSGSIKIICAIAVTDAGEVYLKPEFRDLGEFKEYMYYAESDTFRRLNTKGEDWMICYKGRWVEIEGLPQYVKRLREGTEGIFYYELEETDNMIAYRFKGSTMQFNPKADKVIDKEGMKVILRKCIADGTFTPVSKEEYDEN